LYTADVLLNTDGDEYEYGEKQVSVLRPSL